MKLYAQQQAKEIKREDSEWSLAFKSTPIFAVFFGHFVCWLPAGKAKSKFQADARIDVMPVYQALVYTVPSMGILFQDA
jgi:hypothetical protein